MEENVHDRIPPQNIDAEQSVIGSIFLEPDAIVGVLEYLTPEDFYRQNHQVIFKAMMALNERGEAVDIVTTSNELSEKQQIENAGGQGYLIELAEKVPTAANVEYYAKIVSDKSTLRRLIRTSNEISKEAFTDGGDLASVLDRAERNILEVSEKRNRSGFVLIRDVLNQALESVEARAKSTGDITGIPTGYIELDRMTSGLHADELIILAARPSVGKTAFVLNIAQNVATKAEEVVAIFSLEMGAESLVNRMICSEGSIDAGRLRNGQLTDQEWESFFLAMGSLSKADIYIDDTPGIRVAEIRAKCRRLKQEKGRLGLIVIDYLQLIEGTGRESRQQEVSEISRNLKKLAKELSCPVIALSQLSRGVEQRQDKRPIMSDIRESGSIEQDADIVAFLYRDDYYRQEEGEEPQEPNNVIEVIVEKNRSGPRGTVELIFTKEYNKFTSTVPDQLANSMVAPY
ncbi:replicative DNA helicase [Granulicatella seriolae]|uniref:Replicative DNA helicase n=1 Tax=Granulicatella seriolae TaxID=2967226 RepID=A0ABT1WQV1_9LACT|nr:replicative DNA helicase [Granulicatella seriolae]